MQRTLGTLPWFGRRLSRAGSVFDTSGALTDKAVADQLQKFLRGFAEFAAEKRGPSPKESVLTKSGVVLESAPEVLRPQLRRPWTLPAGACILQCALSRERFFAGRLGRRDASANVREAVKQSRKRIARPMI